MTRLPWTFLRHKVLRTLARGRRTDYLAHLSQVTRAENSLRLAGLLAFDPIAGKALTDEGREVLDRWTTEHPEVRS